MKEPPQMIRGRYLICDRYEYEGYGNDKTRWNGHHIPYFTKEVSEKMLNELQSIDNDFTYRYSQRKDTFIIAQKEVSAFTSKGFMEFRGKDVITDEGKKYLYDIGGTYWDWIKKDTPIKVYIYIDYEEEHEPHIFPTFEKFLEHISPLTAEDQEDNFRDDNDNIVGRLYIRYLHN